MTTEESADVEPAWSIDGKTIFFASNRTGAYQIWKMPAGGGAAEQVTFEGGNRAHISSDGYLYYIKAWSNRTVWRRPLEGGKEEVVLHEAVLFPSSWGPSAGGVYYIDPDGALRFFDVRSGHDSGALVKLPVSEIRVEGGMGISPDGRSVLVPRWRESGTNIMIVDRFR
jgi:sugar lactone lactonase YvrE